MPLCRKSKTTVGQHFNYNVYRKHLAGEEKEEKEFMCGALVLHINMHKVCNCHVEQCMRLVERGRNMFWVLYCFVYVGERSKVMQYKFMVAKRVKFVLLAIYLRFLGILL